MLTSYTKSRKHFRHNWFLINRLITFIFNPFCAYNTSGTSFLDLSLRLTAILLRTTSDTRKRKIKGTEEGLQEKWQKENLNEWHRLFDYIPFPHDFLGQIFIDPNHQSVYSCWLVRDNSIDIIKKEAKLYNDRHEDANKHKCYKKRQEIWSVEQNTHSEIATEKCVS